MANRPSWQTCPPVGSAINVGHPLASGLVAAYLLNEMGGTTAVDGVKRRNATLAGGSIYQNHSVKLDGTDDYASIPVLAPFPLIRSGQPFSLSLWYNVINQNAKYLYSERSSASNTPNYYIRTGNIGNTLAVLVRNDANSILLNAASTNSTSLNSAWHHLVWIDNLGAAEMWIDCVKDATSFAYTPSGVFTLTNCTLGAGIGTAGFSGFLNGSLRNVMFWNRVLSKSEIQRLYTRPYDLYLSPTRRMMITGAASAFNPAWAIGANQIIGGGFAS